MGGEQSPLDALVARVRGPHSGGPMEGLLGGVVGALKSPNDGQIGVPNNTSNAISDPLVAPVVFTGKDALLGTVVVVLSKSTTSGTLAASVSSKIGSFSFPTLNVSSNSKHRPAIMNLPDKMQRSKVRRSLAVALLRAFACLDLEALESQNAQQHPNTIWAWDWDEINAGQLAAKMVPLDQEQGARALTYIQELALRGTPRFDSFMVDTVYSDAPALTDSNNTLAFLLGHQLEQLFDPLTEYSPEPTERAYKPPNETPVSAEITPLMSQICNELVSVQTNFTSLMVSVLQQYIVPLRIVVLKGKINGCSTANLNQVLPPTIDEVTRINCIFLDMLKLAQPYGPYEVLRACGTSIPYFYKALMRNQAATKNFRENFVKLNDTLTAAGRVDLATVDRAKINMVVHSSLHLTKLRLIIHRLYKSNVWPSHLQSNVDTFVQACDDTISSFATDTLTPYNGRVFTPTGKILAEVASGWPPELQNGWLTRRVVAVFDATDILCESVQNRAVIVVFTDNVLFLSINDDQYYANYWDTTGNLTHSPSVADVLMHSLTNETPFTKLPKMNVKSWADVESVDVSHLGSTVKFYNPKTPSFVGVYRLDGQKDATHVSEIVARSKILNKSQSFHLFLNEATPNRNLYFVTHSDHTYINESTKSPLLVVFNKQFNSSLLESHPDAQCLITLNFSNDSTIRIQGKSASFAECIDFEIPVNDLERVLSQLMLELADCVNIVANPSRSAYIASYNETINNYIVSSICKDGTFEKSERQRVIQRSHNVQIEQPLVNEEAQNKTKSLELLNDEDHLGRSGTTKVNKNHAKRKSSALKFFSKSKSNAPLEKVSEKYADTTTEGSIYVNSKFEFPMDEPSGEEHSFLKAARYSKLNDADGNCKGYKDSVDLWAKLDTDTSPNEFYDDMYEFGGKASPGSPTKPGTTFDAETKLQISKQGSPKKTITIGTAAPATKPPPQKANTLSRSDSYYVKFQQMRSRQEDLIKKNGISEVSDLVRPVNFLSSPSITRRLSQLGLKDDDGEGENWVKFGSNANLNTIVKSSEMYQPPKREQIQTILESPIKAQPFSPLKMQLEQQHSPVKSLQECVDKPLFQKASSRSSSVKLISSTVIKNVTPVHNFSPVAEDDKHGDSFGSSIYESSIIADFGNFNSIHSNKPYNNPYNKVEKMNTLAEHDASPLEDVESSQYVDQRSEKSDSVDFFGDLNLDLSRQDDTNPFNCTPHDTMDDAPAVSITPRNKVTVTEKDFAESELAENDNADKENDTCAAISTSPVTPPADMSLCSVLEDTTQAEMLLCAWNQTSPIKKSETAMGLQSLLTDKSYAYLNAVFADKHMEKSHLVRDPTHWNLANFPQ